MLKAGFLGRVSYNRLGYEENCKSSDTHGEQPVNFERLFGAYGVHKPAGYPEGKLPPRGD